MKSGTRPGGAKRRVRRTAEQARALVLDVAEQRLASLGLAGLAIADVAGQAGISHATLLHHFGTSGQMRVALVERLATRLLSEVAELLERDDLSAGHGDFLRKLFVTLAGGGHARLIGWLHLTNEIGPVHRGEHSRNLFRVVLDGLRDWLVARGLDAEQADKGARHLVLLVVSSAIGFGIARETLLEDVGLAAGEELQFADWLGDLLYSLGDQPLPAPPCPQG